MIIPPFAGVALVECRDRIELTPYYWCREFVGLGRCPAGEVAPTGGPVGRAFFEAAFGNEPIWVIATWHRFDDGREEALRMICLDPGTTKEKALQELEREIEFTNKRKEDLEALASCFEATPDDLAYIDNRFPNFQDPNAGTLDQRDLYQARLKALGGLQPKTAELVHRAESETDEKKRALLQAEAVQAFFADLAHYWTEESIKEWQRSNPVGSEWMCEFARVMGKPKRTLDPVNYELALNWLRGKYNLLTAEELSDAISKATGEHVPPATIKKRRQRLGLTTKRPPGPRQNSEG